VLKVRVAVGTGSAIIAISNKPEFNNTTIYKLVELSGELRNEISLEVCLESPRYVMFSVD
jgi:hypothetical protein